MKILISVSNDRLYNGILNRTSYFNSEHNLSVIRMQKTKDT